VKTGASVTFAIGWPGSDVVLTLRSPNGRVITRGTLGSDLQHRVGPTYELWTTTDPEPGTWTVEMFGRQVAPLGEPTTLLVTEEVRPNQAPVADIKTSQNGRAVTVDARASTDSDGSVSEYFWEFGDGTTATGPTATHKYVTAGEYRITLAVRDNGGLEAFAATEGAITIPKYTFSGFRQPVEPQPALNKINAGRAVPMKFSLGADHGLDILAAGSPSSGRIDCSSTAEVVDLTGTVTAGSSGLAYDAVTGQYTYVWKTQDSWAGTCRRFTLRLDDGSTHSVDFAFRK